MKRGLKPAPAIMALRMKPLPHQHRIAHLTALAGLQTVGSRRWQELVVLLRSERTAQPKREGGSA
jgi:hypothetical protein